MLVVLRQNILQLTFVVECLFSGATVYMVCRSKEKGETALSAIRSKTGNENVHLEVFFFLYFLIYSLMYLFNTASVNQSFIKFSNFCNCQFDIWLQTFSPCVLLLKLLINFSLQLCDLSSITEIKSFANRFSLKDKPVHVLVKLPYLLLQSTFEMHHFTWLNNQVILFWLRTYILSNWNIPLFFFFKCMNQYFLYLFIALGLGAMHVSCSW